MKPRTGKSRPVPAVSGGRRILRVILLGALLAAGAWVALGPPGGRGDAARVVVTEAQVAHQHARWVKQWNRPPTRSELRAAVDAYIRSEVLYREALARGMDREDPRVRLALVQKMEMLAAGRADAREVEEEELASYFALRREGYAVPARLSFVQVFFKEDGGEERAGQLADRFDRDEPADEEVAVSGDASLLARVHDDVSAEEIEDQFGADFAAAVRDLTPGHWSGPVRSPYGFHAVKLLEHVPERIPVLDEVRDRVETDLRYEAQLAAREQSYLEIAGKYRVRMTDGARLLLEGEAR